ncbi:hypothetical protein DFH08DRAFT_956715 [Mycena albidolilacea]|uniref:NAD(P)-binding protein n=1 Tax=Mycena albidolilacea TaxID=1033008 RepID=A0AAD7AC34_9AGAR|nr:hypothetical protein DFH08DRAFT_956715 [Mycena albidolilacea]
MSPLIAFIIGAGQNIGEHTAAVLKAKGYQVVLGSRKPAIDQIKKDGYFPVAVNIESPESVQAAFAQITKDLGPPNVVIFNAATVVPPPVPEDPLTLSLEDFKRQTDVGVAVYAAAQEALKGFRSETHKGAHKTFIITGNALPWIPADDGTWFGLNIQKVMEWRLMEMLSTAYSKEGSRWFYFVSLVGENGAVVEPLSSFFTSGPQHAQIYLDLITRDDQTDWEYRFTLDAKKWTRK